MDNGLTRNITVSGAVLLIGLIFGFMMFQENSEIEQIVEITETQNSNLGRPLSNILWDQFAVQLTEFSGLKSDDIRNHPSQTQLDDLIRKMIAGTRVVAVKLFDLSGRTIYSTTPSEIGTISEDLKTAIASGPMSRLHMPELQKGISGEIQNAEIVETYLPLKSNDGKTVGAIGLRTDVTQVVGLVKKTSIRTIIVTLLALFLLAGVLIAVSIRAGKNADRQYLNIKSYQDTLTELHDITATVDQDSRTTITRILELGCQVYHLPIAVLGRAVGENYFVENTVGCEDDISVGDVFTTNDTFCSLAIGADKPVGYHNVSTSNLIDAPYYKKFGFEAYTGTPVYVGGEHYGALAFVGAKARGEPFSDDELSLLRLFALWIGKEIERENIQESLHQNVDTLTSLHKIATTPQSTPTENIRKIIQLGIQEFGLDMGIVGHVFDDTYMFAHVYGSEEAPPAGTKLPMSDTYCQFAFHADGPLGLHDVNQSKLAAEPCYEKLGLEAYVGTPLFVNGKRYGTLCFASGRIRETPFTDNELTLIQLFASWIGTEIHRDQSAARERLLTRLLDTTREGYWSIDNDGETIDVNPAMSRILGRPRADIIGRSIFDFVDKANAQIFRDEIARRRRGEFDAYEIGLLQPDGSILTCINNATPTYDDRGEKIGSIGLWTDITAIKAAQDKVQNALRKAEEANESKSRFLASASHDLRQPLQALNLFVAILKTTNDPEKIAATIEKLEGSINVLGSLLNALLDISKLEAGLVVAEETDFAISDLFKSMQEFESVASSRSLDFRIVDSSLHIRSDRNLLESILRNLIDNALKYTEAGKVLVGCRRCGENVRIEVLDTGIGVEPDQTALIFEEFYQIDNDARNREEGLGLGLSIVKRTADLLGHRIGSRSTRGKGSVFSVMVPAVEDIKKKPTSVPCATMNAATDSLVMIIDDDAAVLEGMESLLEALGCEVVSSDYAEGPMTENRRLVSKCPRTPDLIIADYRLPGSDTGVDVVRKLRQEFDVHVPAILLTGEISKDFTKDSDQNDLLVLNKPIDAEQLLSVMDRLIRVRTPEVAE